MEEYRPVKGYEGYYEISNFGNLRSVDRIVVRNDNVKHHYRRRYMTKRFNRDGYPTYKLSKDGVGKIKFAHRLVAEAFLDNPNQYSDVNHIDSNRANCNLDNLEWLDHKSNVSQSISEGRHFCTRDIKGANNPNYGNTTLHEFYQQHPEVAKTLLSRKGTHNGRSKPVVLIDNDNGTSIPFCYIGECVDYLIKSFNLDVNVDYVRQRISTAANNGKQYLGLNFKFI